MKLVVTIDVEEEGLFTGKYDPSFAPTTNIPSLTLLNEIFMKWKIRPTLLVTYQVAMQRNVHELLLRLREGWGAEIGAHLHYWNTPPITKMPFPDPVPSELIPTEILRQKLDCLLESFQPLDIEPRSFRMGRFSFGPKMFSLLQESKILVDSSVAPLRIQYGGPDHLAAPIDPYYPSSVDILSYGTSDLLEVPITIVPVHRRIGRLLDKAQKRFLSAQDTIGWISSRLCSLPVQPVWTGLRRLKIASALHLRRGGGVLTLFLHSSELQPGNSPIHPTPQHVQSFIKKLDMFFQWLHNYTSVKSVTLQGLRNDSTIPHH